MFERTNEIRVLDERCPNVDSRGLLLSAHGHLQHYHARDRCSNTSSRDTRYLMTRDVTVRLCLVLMILVGRDLSFLRRRGGFASFMGCLGCLQSGVDRPGTFPTCVHTVRADSF